MKTLYITDLDGTLLNNDEEITEFTSNNLNYLIQKGIQFSFATARTSPETVKNLSSISINNPVILLNGVLIYDMNEKKYLKIEIIPNDIVCKIVEKFIEFNIAGFMYGIKENELIAFYENLNSKSLMEFYNQKVDKIDFIQVKSFDVAKDNNIINFTLRDTKNVLEPIFNAIKDFLYIEIMMFKDTENIWCLEIYSSNASKYKAVLYLREHYGYEKIIGFGDNYNDLPLFKACDESYAVENAIEEIKSTATAVIESNENDGVTKWIIDNFKF